MRYISTRGGGAPQRFSDILLEGLAPDGGLYVPEAFPEWDPAWRGLSYSDLAFKVLSLFADDVPDLQAIVRKTYTAATFGSEEITPLKTLAPDLHLLGLSNGPSLAFKDVALQLLGTLFESVLEKKKQSLNILGATSGDTGPAAETAMRGKHGIRVFMLSPHGRMSAFQAAQMYSLQDANIFNLAVKGSFDDCQDLVKRVNADAAFKQRHRIGAVNSINWARIAAQVVYYFKGYFAATKKDAEQVSFAVPTGNFGNIYAGYVALRMGLPIRRLVLATNENDVLDRFFRAGTYAPEKAAAATSSPSMDITRASNFERYVFELAERDAEGTKRRFLRDEFTLFPGKEFASGRSSHADRLKTIKGVFEKYQTIIDPHTADGLKVGLEHREPGVPLICMETAQPAKFAATVGEALGRPPARPKGFEGLEGRPQRVEVIGADAEALKKYIEKNAP